MFHETSHPLWAQSSRKTSRLLSVSIHLLSACQAKWRRYTSPSTAFKSFFLKLINSGHSSEAVERNILCSEWGCLLVSVNKADFLKCNNVLPFLCLSPSPFPFLPFCLFLFSYHYFHVFTSLFLPSLHVSRLWNDNFFVITLVVEFIFCKQLFFS